MGIGYHTRLTNEESHETIEVGVEHHYRPSPGLVRIAVCTGSSIGSQSLCVSATP